MADSPGGVEVGRVSVRVVPDTSKFLRQAKKDLEKIEKQLKVTVDLVLDSSKVSEQVKKAERKADGRKVKMDVEVDGDGVARETRRVKNLAQKLVGAIKMTVGLNVPGSVAKIKAEMAVIRKVVQGYNLRIPMDLVSWSKWLGILGAASGLLLTMPHLIGAIGGAAAYAAGALALMPAVLVAAGFGVASLVVGMQGFGEALKNSGDPVAFAESLKKLTPSAQASAKALAGFKEPLKEIKAAVQENLFKGMAEPLKELKVLLPPIKQGLVGSAGGIREMTKAWIKMATSQKSVKDTEKISANVTKMFENMRPAAASFGDAMRNITVVGTTFLPKLGTALSNSTAKFARWAEASRDNGQLEAMIQNFIDKTKQLGRVIADVWVGFRNIFTGMTGGEEFLDIIERITQGFRDWTSLSDTQATLARVGNVMRVVADAAWTLFQQVFKSAGAVLKDLEPFLIGFAQTLGAVVGGAIRAITPILQSMARWLSENKEVTVPLIITILALVTAFKLFVTLANGILGVKKSIDALRAAGGIISELTGNVVGNLKTMIKKIALTTSAWFAAAGRWAYAWGQIAMTAIAQAARTSGAWIASAAKSAAFTARYYLIMARQAIANFVRVAVAATVNATRVAAVWIAQMARMVASTIAQMAIAAGVWIANWVRMAVVSLVQAARMAAAWLIAMGPIGWIIAAVIALAALIIANWDKIVAFLEGVWNWIKELAATIWGAISQFFVDLWNSISGAVVDAWNAIGDFFSSLWSTITNSIKTAWNAILNFFSSLWDKIKSGVSTAIQAVLDFAKSLPGKIWDGIKSAGNALYDAGRWIIEGLVNGLKSAAGAIWNFIKGICNDVWEGIKDFFGISSPSREMMKIGKWINQGWAIGLKRYASDVTEQALSISGAVYDAFTPLTGMGSDWADSITDSAPAALAAVSKLMDSTNEAANAEWKGQITAENLESPEERVLAALANGLVIELDGKNVAKSVNYNNRMNERRR